MRKSTVLVEFINSDVTNFIYGAFLSTDKTTITAAILGGDHANMIRIEPVLSSEIIKIKNKAKQLKENHFLEEFVVSCDCDIVDVKCNGEWHRVDTVKQLMWLVFYSSCLDFF